MKPKKFFGSPLLTDWDWPGGSCGALQLEKRQDEFEWREQPLGGKPRVVVLWPFKDGVALIYDESC